MRGARVVVVSDNRPVRETLKVVLGGQGPVVAIAASDCANHAEVLESASVVVTDLPPSSLTERVQAVNPLFSRPVLGITPAGKAAAPAGALPFDPTELIERVGAAIDRPTDTPAPEALSSITALLPREIAANLPRIATSSIPILLLGEAGTGKFRVARVIQSLRGDRLLSMTAADCSLATLRAALASLGPQSTTLLLEDVRGLPPQSWNLLRDLTTDQGLSVDGDWHSIRIVASSAGDFEEIRQAFAANQSLLHGLSGAILRLTPLRQRQAEIDSLVAAVCRRSARPAARFSAAALDVLRNYLWPGNVAELEAVVARTVLSAASDEIGADDVRLSPHDSATSVEVAQPSDAGRSPGPDNSFDLLVTELAHDFKNPMVVIKTAAQHLERVLDDSSGAKDFARMTGEAVDRMDRALDNLLQFSRFEDPEAGDIAMRELFTSCLANIEDELADRRIAVEQRLSAAELVHVDPLQMAHALENLLRAMLRDLGPGTTLQVRSLPEARGFSIEMPLPKQRVSEHLASAAGRSGGSKEPLSMGVRMAQQLIERNGGRIAFGSSNDRRIIRVELPSGGGVVESDEATTRFDS